MASAITPIREALLAYVARYGVADRADRRLLAARLWRALPRGLNAAQTIVETDRLLSAWVSRRLGFSISSAQLRLAVLETGADARLLLAEDVSSLISALSPALLQPVPHETPVAMPVQSLAKAGLAGLLRPAPAAIGQAA